MSTQTERMQRLYRFQARIYDHSRWAFLFGRHRAIRMVKAKPAESILDLGCGTGRWLPELARQVGPEGRIIGIDCVSTVLDRARRRCRALPPVQLIQADFLAEAGRLPSFDAILLSYSLSMMPAWQATLTAARKLLVPGGRLIVVDFLTCPTPGLASLFRAHRVQFGADRREELQAILDLHRDESHRAYGGAWSWYLLAGRRCAKAQ